MIAHRIAAAMLVVVLVAGSSLAGQAAETDRGEETTLVAQGNFPIRDKTTGSILFLGRVTNPQP